MKMGDNRKPKDAMNDTKRIKEAKGGKSGDNNVLGARPKYHSGGASKFVVNDWVHYQVGTTLYGPFLVAKVSQPQVYVLCDAAGNYVQNGAEFNEASLLRARGTT
ncbi:hypothetical protein F5Y18DRAFT_389667 [Xylariaceae sp. FL1019]|nr:hypothetical protein F5Y18DRAFT_389667 [Xylariaceae sp. FL1019]